MEQVPPDTRGPFHVENGAKPGPCREAMFVDVRASLSCQSLTEGFSLANEFPRISDRNRTTWLISGPW